MRWACASPPAGCWQYGHAALQIQALALVRLADPFFLRKRFLESRPNRLSKALCGLGPSTFSPCGECCHGRYPQIHPGRALVFSGTQGDSVGSDGDADKPPVRHPGDGSGDELAPKTQRLPHPYPPQMGDADAAAVEGKLVIGQGKTVIHPLLAELRILCTPQPVG